MFGSIASAFRGGGPTKSKRGSSSSSPSSNQHPVQSPSSSSSSSQEGGVQIETIEVQEKNKHRYPHQQPQQPRQQPDQQQQHNSAYIKMEEDPTSSTFDEEFFFSSSSSSSSNVTNPTAVPAVPAVGDASLPLSPVMNNSTTPPLLPNATFPDANTTSMDEDTLSTVLSGFLPLFFMLALCICSTRGGEDRSMYYRGRQMRLNYQERERRRLQSESRKELTPEQRQQQIDTHFKTMTVIKKQKRKGGGGGGGDEEEGGVIEFVLEEDKSQDDCCCNDFDDSHDCSVDVDGKIGTDQNYGATCESDHGDDIENQLATLSSPDSPNGVDHFPVEESTATPQKDDIDKVVSCLSSTDGCSAETEVDIDDGDDCQYCDDFDDEDDGDVCHICLDSFDVGDRVMWAKHFYASTGGGSGSGSACRHVFHVDCIMPWLMEKRENECPSCRRCLVHDDRASGEEEQSSTAASGATPQAATPNNNAESDTISPSDIEEGGSGGETDKTKPDVEEGIEVTLSSSRAILQDEMDGQYRYVIVKGLIEQIPLNGDDAAKTNKINPENPSSRYEINHASSTETRTTVASSDDSESDGEDSDSQDGDQHAQDFQPHTGRGKNYVPGSSSVRTDNLRLPSFDQRMDLLNSLVGASQAGPLTTIPLQRRQASFTIHDFELEEEQQQH
eukprot:CAMPEP_0113461424 /NCGR_PEP_ID=MMETSP0014_2-20120614/11536_1 /TAXON_ID=2857 /ORGANISM="Nitzschia sp." /LENGTH=670 /DNA_ID=CAMNT_0000353189 /DNA_START=266 /DNA_END=2278 /DNA_ORIENTATION=+ /assembly_acc=CAM_ASM_000159